MPHIDTCIMLHKSYSFLTRILICLHHDVLVQEGTTLNKKIFTYHWNGVSKVKLKIEKEDKIWHDLIIFEYIPHPAIPCRHWLTRSNSFFKQQRWMFSSNYSIYFAKPAGASRVSIRYSMCRLAVFGLHPHSVHGELLAPIDLQPPVHQVLHLLQASLGHQLPHFIWNTSQLSLTL